MSKTEVLCGLHHDIHPHGVTNTVDELDYTGGVHRDHNGRMLLTNARSEPWRQARPITDVGLCEWLLASVPFVLRDLQFVAV